MSKKIDDALEKFRYEHEFLTGSDLRDESA